MSINTRQQKRPDNEYQVCSYRLVAEDGFEHIDLQVMGLTSYHCSTPRFALLS